uniref:Uncharacterized protein n=1 Tax=Timema tahoe TaxID=61484 RepID=A0A7R9IUM5_9NEOP|nr:unnamed protein product [Timema tahoe]CAD7464730.1 unnamed protein product [Timema tahoe]
MEWASFAYETGPFHSISAPHLRRTKSDYETGPFHFGLGRCRPVFSIDSYLRRTKSDYETGPKTR